MRFLKYFLIVMMILSVNVLAISHPSKDERDSVKDNRPYEGQHKNTVKDNRPYEGQHKNTVKDNRPYVTKH